MADLKLIMKYFMLKVMLMAATTMIVPWLALAQQSAQGQSQTVWGAVSNKVCAGVSVEQSNWGSSHKDDFECIVELGNTTTNLLWVWFPPLERRCDIQLLGPDGNRVRQLKPFFHGLKTRWSGLAPLSTNSTSTSLDWFFLKDTFDVRTNGRFALIASVRVNVFTNFAVGQYQMENKPTYCLLPPVTNTFNVSMP